MNGHRFFLSLALLAPIAHPLAAGDLSKIERKIRKEPAYKSKAVHYGLLVFGVEAKTRVWVVIDGDTLYFDRNGNGDLTEDGEKIAANDSGEDYHYFKKIDEIRAGKLVHKNFSIGSEINEGKQLCSICAHIEMPGLKGGGVGGRVWQSCQSATLADSPRNAPIMHFGGAWQLALQVDAMRHDEHGAQLLHDATSTLALELSTPGIGPGSTVTTQYNGTIPKTAFPIAEITYPPTPNQPNAPPVRERYELKKRC